jgi:hypothetical protein
MHKSNPIHKLPRAYRIPIVSERGKWIDETLKKTMDAIGNDNITLRKVSRLWSIPLSSLSNHLNDRTRTKKVRIEKVLITKEDAKIVTWILTI